MRPLLLCLALLVTAACSREESAERGADARPTGEASTAGAQPAAGGAVEPEMRTFRAWEAACDNTRSCTLFGFPAGEEFQSAGAEGWGFIRIERAGAADAEPIVTLAAGEAAGAGGGITAGVDDGPPYRVEASEANAPYHLGQLRGAQAGAFVAELRKGRAVQLTPSAGPAGTVSLDGAAAALLWMDERQGRAGTAVRPGAVAPPVVRAVRPVGGAVTPSPALLRAPEVAACVADIPDAMDTEITGTRLTPELVLWEVPCGAGAYNFTTAFFFGDTAGGGLKPVSLSSGGRGDGEPANHLVNAGLDPATGRIEAFTKARGIGDCGAEEAWVWDGRAFILVHQRVMGRCAGVTVDDWPVLRRAVVR